VFLTVAVSYAAASGASVNRFFYNGSLFSETDYLPGDLGERRASITASTSVGAKEHV
jgi:hypothetical protein